MKNKIAIALLFAACTSLVGQVKTTFDEAQKKEFEHTISHLYKEYNMVGDFIIGVVDETGLVYSFAINQAIIEGESTNLGNSSPLYIASHTKSFTGTMLKLLEEEGTIDLNNSLHDYIPSLNYSDSIDTKAITIKQLLNHTHGTHGTRFTWKTAFLGYSGENEELINDLNSDFMHDPTGRFRYSNTGPILAAMAGENAAGKPWKEIMNERIFTPLNMKNTSAHVSKYDSNDILPSITVSKQNKILQSSFYKKDITMHASGGVISTINDLSLWLKANINQDEQLLSRNSWNELHSSTASQKRTYFTYDRHGYSLGWDLATYKSDTILTRFGGLAGISFHASFMPNRKVGIIAFSNEQRAFFLPHLAANYLYNTLNGSNTNNTFEEEKKLFDKAFTRVNVAEENTNFATNMVGLEGRYTNEKGWPEIEVYKEKEGYAFKWGVLSGAIYLTNEQGIYMADLGVLERNFKIEGDQLRTGSLVYKKTIQP